MSFENVFKTEADDSLRQKGSRAGSLQRATAEAWLGWQRSSNSCGTRQELVTGIGRERNL